MTDDNSRSGRTSRRPLLKLAAGGAALVTAGTAARLPLHPGEGDDPAPEPGALALSTHAGTDVASLHLPLGEDVLPRVGPGRWESRRLPTSTHSMVAFTWAGDQEPPTVLIRSRAGAVWGGWARVPVLHDLPDPVAGEGRGVAGTDLIWIGRADGIQVKVTGRRPQGLTLVLLHPQRRPGDPFLGEPAARSAAAGAAGAEEEPRAPRPSLVTRKEWGANESLREGRPSYNETLKQVHVHHTVNSNGYSRDDVPALIRGMYAYHTQTLGWSDIGYNFLVDRFGRAFVGRAGGPAKLVRGAHTLGFNAESTGVSAIGNYETVRPSDAMLDAIAAIAAWKLDPFDRNPRGEVRVESEGSDKYAAGRTVRLPVIDGHRDTNDTACPGQHLYEALPKVRRRAARIIAAAREAAIVVEQPAGVAGTARLGQELRADPGTYRPADAAAAYQWLRDGAPVPDAREQTYVLGPGDVGHQVTCEVSLSAPDLDPVVQRPAAVGPVVADPVLTVATTVRRGVVRVRVTVAAPAGVEPVPGGTVTVRVGERSRTLTVDGGPVVARVGSHRRLPPGTYPVSVTYAGDLTFTAASDDGTVRVT